MNYCHTCVFYNTQTGWCSAHNESHSSSGSCRKWRSGNSSRREKPKFTPFDGSGKDSKKGGKSGSKKKYKGMGCGTCIWWDQDSMKCTNKDSEAYNTAMPSGALCTIYQQYPGAPLMSEERLRKRLVLSYPRIDRPKPARKNTSKASSKKSNKKSLNVKASLPKKAKTTYDKRPQTKQSNPPRKIGSVASDQKKRGPNDRCNRCQYYENGKCQNESSNEYRNWKKPMNWCASFVLCSWLKQ